MPHETLDSPYRERFEVALARGLRNDDRMALLLLPASQWACQCGDCYWCAEETLLGYRFLCSCESCQHVLECNTCSANERFAVCHQCERVHIYACPGGSRRCNFCPCEEPTPEEEREEEFPPMVNPCVACGQTICRCSLASQIPSTLQATIERAVYGGYPHFNARRFGVEIECYGGRTDSSALGYRLDELAREYGYSQEIQIGYDGSIFGTNAIEVKIGPVGGARGIKFTERVARCLIARGFRVNDSCGLHVHHDLSPLGRSEAQRAMANLGNFYSRFQGAFSALLSASRWQNSYCRTIERNTISGARFFVRSRQEGLNRALNGDRYLSLNVQSYGIHRTVEFRQHHACLVPMGISNWVVLTQLAVNKAADHGFRRRIRRSGTPAHPLRELFRELIDPRDPLSVAVRNYYKGQATFLATRERRAIPRFSVPKNRNGNGNHNTHRREQT